MKRFKFIRCKSKRDILVVNPKTFRSFAKEGEMIPSNCGHAHPILAGPIRFQRCPHEPIGIDVEANPYSMTLKICGINYSYALFQAMKTTPVGTRFEVMGREGEYLTLKKLERP